MKMHITRDEYFITLFVIPFVFTFLSYYVLDGTTATSAINHAIVTGLSVVTLGMLYMLGKNIKK